MKIVMPQLGETVAEGTVMVWHKKVGERIEARELLFEVGTDKVETEIPAPVSGILTDILVPEGETVDVGVTLAIIDDGSGASDTEPAAEMTSTADAAPARARQERGAHGKRGAAEKRLSPVVRKLLAEHGVAAEDVEGTGADGRITRRDVLAYVEGSGKKEKRPPPKASGKEVIPFNRRRKLTAEHMVRSKATSAHVLQAVEADFMGVERLRNAQKEQWKEKEGFSLTYLPFIARSVCLAIADFPKVNASIDGESLIVHGAIHLAIAVDLNFDGLVAPVIRDAGSKRLAELAREINTIANRARDNKLQPDDLAGATYTISNSGSFGTLITAPIINQPQVAILSADGVKKKPVVIEGPGGDSIAIHPVGILAQSFDHRAMDGAYSAAFLRRTREIIEEHDWVTELA